MSKSTYSFYTIAQSEKQALIASFGFGNMSRSQSFYRAVHKNWQTTTKKPVYERIAAENQERISRAVEKYEVKNKDRVESFLHRNPDIINIVEQTFIKVNEFFSDVDQVLLDIFEDPEDNSRTLIATIVTGMEIDESLEKLDEFDKYWFTSKFVESEGLFNVSLAVKNAE